MTIFKAGIFRKLFIFIPVIILVLVASGYILLNIIWFFFVEPLPSEELLAYVIKDDQIDYTLEMYNDNKSNLYWLESVDKNSNKKRLIMRAGDIHGTIKVKVVGHNKISLLFDYDEGNVLKDKTIYLDLSKNDVYNVTFIRKFLEQY